MRALIRRRKRWLVLAGIVAVVLVPVLVERYRGLIALRRWQRQALAAGEKLTLAELVPPLAPGSAARTASPFELQARLVAFTARLDLPEPMRCVQPGKARVVWQQREWSD